MLTHLIIIWHTWLIIAIYRHAYKIVLCYESISDIDIYRHIVQLYLEGELIFK